VTIRSETPPVAPDRRAARRQETKDEIVAAAWELVATKGLAGLAMRDLGEMVGMKAQSIYSYFASKNEIYDAMFHEGYLAFAGIMDATSAELDPREETRLMAHRFFEFCTSNPVRYQLLFQRTIPDFVPSEESYAAALDAYDAMARQLSGFGVSDPQALDLLTAMLTGLTDQQISNDPGGSRWAVLIDRSIDMLLREIAPQLFKTTKGKS
jgi:AcrR family transcriptional regulator